MSPGPFTAWGGQPSPFVRPSQRTGATVATTPLCSTPPAERTPQPGGLSSKKLVKNNKPPGWWSSRKVWNAFAFCEPGRAGTSRLPGYHLYEVFGIVIPLLLHQHPQDTTGPRSCQPLMDKIPLVIAVFSMFWNNRPPLVAVSPGPPAARTRARGDSVPAGAGAPGPNRRPARHHQQHAARSHPQPPNGHSPQGVGPAPHRPVPLFAHLRMVSPPPPKIVPYSGRGGQLAALCAAK